MKLNYICAQVQHKNSDLKDYRTKFIVEAYESTYYVPSPNYTRVYSHISFHYHLAAVTTMAGQNSPVAFTVFFGGQLKWLLQKLSLLHPQPEMQLRAAIYFPLRALSPFQRTVLLRCQLYQLCPPSHHLARLIPQRSTRLTLSYPAGKPKHRSNLVLAENGLISASRDQEEGEECKHVCAIGRAAWLSLLRTAGVFLRHPPGPPFFFFLAAL